jgi:hypothetical protein
MIYLIISCAFVKASQDQALALTLERLLNQGINYSDIADQFLWDREADSQVVGAGRTDPYPTILTLPDERFEGQVKGQERRSNHQWCATFRIAEDQHVGLLHRETDSSCFSTVVNMGKEGQLPVVYSLLEAFQGLLYRKWTGSGQNTVY